MILNLIESVSEGFPSYSWLCSRAMDKLVISDTAEISLQYHNNNNINWGK